MNGVTLLVFLSIGTLAGWFAGKGYGLGLIGDVVVGFIGAFMGGGLFRHFHVVRGSGLLNDSVGATVGAIILLIAVRLVQRSTWERAHRPQTRKIWRRNTATARISTHVAFRGGRGQA